MPLCVNLQRRPYLLLAMVPTGISSWHASATPKPGAHGGTWGCLLDTGSVRYARDFCAGRIPADFTAQAHRTLCCARSVSSV
ncbi:hypothetical protein FKP32DRAFT_107123 [Trametes sanguinea]|nr:hypothetical protein FKP32DRAFT_107123 [Trametes sanguinea]